MSLLKKVYGAGLMSAVISCVCVNAVADDCATNTVTSGNLQIDQSMTDRGCTLKVHPVVQPKAYRAIELDQRGALEIFNQYDVANPTASKSTATRTYFIFPRMQAPTFVLPASAGTIGDDPLFPAQLITASGDPILYLQGRRSNGGVDDGSLPQITSSDSPNFQLIEDPEVTTDNGGGVDVLLSENAQVLLLDCGYRKGGSACNLPNGSSSFVDRRRIACTLPNRALFNYVKSEAQLKWKDDASLFAYLRKACPDLSLPSRLTARRSKTQPTTRLPAEAVQAKKVPTRSIQ